MNVVNFLKTTSNKLHNFQHVENMQNEAEKLIFSEKIKIDRHLLNQAILWHDVGKAKFGENIFTVIFDGPLSAFLYWYYNRRSFDQKVFKIIWRHTRFFYFLGPKIDRFLYNTENREERILVDLDLLEMINPKRFAFSKKLIKFTSVVLKTISEDHFYFNYSKLRFEQYRKHYRR